MIRRAIACLVVITGATGCLLTKIENALVYHPSPYPSEAHFDPPLENAEFDNSVGIKLGDKLHGLYLEAPHPKAVVLYLHGNGGNVVGCAQAMRGFHAMGASILAFDYRGYGRSEGSPSEGGILADARAARKWLAKRANVREQDIVLVGHSLGGGVAVDLAAKDGARGLVLENTFTSLPDVAEKHFPYLPVHWLMSNRLDSKAKIGSYHGPLLQTHGDADPVVPYELGRALFLAANEPKRFVKIPGGGHNELWASPTAGKAYKDELKTFLDTLP